VSERTYTADDMQVLEGLDAVRKRVGMYIGSNDSRGLQHTAWEIIDNAVDEALAGHCSTITVTLHDDGSIEVTDDGRGIPTDVNTKLGKTGVEIAFEELHGGGKFGGSGYAASGGLHGVGASVVNALSSRLEVGVSRGGHRYEISYQRGVPGTFSKAGAFSEKPGLRKAGKADKGATGTSVRYWPDAQIFTADAVIDLDKTLERARQTCFLVPGLAISVTDARGESPVEHAFRFDGGITDFVEFIAPGEPVSQALMISGEGDYLETVPMLEGDEMVTREVARTMQVEVGLKWVNDFDADVRSFTNIVATPKGGTHVAGFERALVKAVREAAAGTRGLKLAKDGITKDDILEGLKAVVLVRISEPQFEGQTKEILGTPAASKIVAQVVSDALTKWLTDRRTKNEAKKVLEKVARASVTREQVRQAKETRRRKSALEAAENLPSKLADCRSTDLEFTELFIVEGDSAGGTVKAARDSETQAVLPLRGKLLNVYKSTTEKRMLENAECAAILAAIGAGVGKGFEVGSRRYGRTCLLMDGDTDGSHIRTLVISLLLRHCRPLLEGGHVYAAVPPLYITTVKNAKEPLYAFTETEQLQVLARLKKEGKQVKGISRLKGLGEMSSEQMELVLLDGRVMRQLTVEDGEAADRMFELLMGPDVAARRDYIVTNALQVSSDRIDA
jgi:DNA gyrase subunit B